jgi:hypothetical protein
MFFRNNSACWEKFNSDRCDRPGRTASLTTPPEVLFRAIESEIRNLPLRHAASHATSGVATTPSVGCGADHQNKALRHHEQVVFA